MKLLKHRLLAVLVCLCLCLGLCTLCPVQARAEGEMLITKVLTTTTFTPVALMERSAVQAATSTSGVYIADYSWTDVDTGALITDNFSTRPAEVEITLGTYDGLAFADNVAVYLNNSPASYILSADHRYLTLSRTYSPEVWKPSVIKNPQDETVDEGDYASFSATATYSMGYKWMVLNPANWEHFPAEELPDRYGVTVKQNGVDNITVYGVTAAMDGLRFYCTFLGAVKGDYYNADSLGATLHVRAAPAAAVEPEEPELPEETPPPEETEAPAAETPAPEEHDTPVEEAHTHVFSDAWSYDTATHWRECECGERTEQGAHTLEWTLSRRATRKLAGLETGTCPVCGYTLTRETSYDGISDGLRLAIVGVGGLTVLTLTVLIIDSIRSSIRRKRQRRARRRSGTHARR